MTPYPTPGGVGKSIGSEFPPSEAPPSKPPDQNVVAVSMDDVVCEPLEFDVDAGQPVTVEVDNRGIGSYSFAIESLDLHEHTPPGEVTTIELTFDQEASTGSNASDPATARSWASVSSVRTDRALRRDLQRPAMSASHATFKDELIHPIGRFDDPPGQAHPIPTTRPTSAANPDRAQSPPSGGCRPGRPARTRVGRARHPS